MKKNRTAKMENAFKMGIIAFEKGMECIPAHDKDLMEIATIKGIPFEEACNNKNYDVERAENAAAIDAWVQGWTFANIGAGKNLSE